jgi:hypothetical protein
MTSGGTTAVGLAGGVMTAPARAARGGTAAVYCETDVLSPGTTLGPMPGPLACGTNYDTGGDPYDPTSYTPAAVLAYKEAFYGVLGHDVAVQTSRSSKEAAVALPRTGEKLPDLHQPHIISCGVNTDYAFLPTLFGLFFWIYRNSSVLCVNTPASPTGNCVTPPYPINDHEVLTFCWLTCTRLANSPW